MKYFNIAILAFGAFLLATPAQAISFSIGRHGVSVGTGHGYGHGWRRGYYAAPAYTTCYDSWGRPYTCRVNYAPPPVIVYPHKKKWKKHWKRKHRGWRRR